MLNEGYLKNNAQRIPYVTCRNDVQIYKILLKIQGKLEKIDAL